MTPLVPRRRLYGLVFVVGAASLGTEIAAARLLAPYFGASTIVWANTISVVLVSLAVGYWLGGRFADRHPDLRSLCVLALIAAVLLAAVPFASRPFLRFSVDAFETVSVGGFLGSLFGVLILVAVPVVLLGAVSPWAVRLAVDDIDRSGEVAGRLYAISTAGSLLGTMASALFLIPFLGTQRTFLIFAATLASIAVLGLGIRALAIAAPLAFAIALPVGAIKAADTGRVLYEVETPYQYARVVEQRDGDRALELNEGQAVHSLYRPGSYLTGDYWDTFLVLPFAAGNRVPSLVAMLGSGAGTVARSYGHFFPRTHVEAVEIDGELVDLGRRFFDFRNPNMHVFTEDARPWLERSPGGYDAILVDAYRQPYIPFYLATREFFSLARARLAPRGTVIVNVGHPEGSTELETALGRTMSDVFPVVMRAPVEPNNVMLVGSDGRISPHGIVDAIALMPKRLRPTARRVAARLRAPLAGGEVWTDDRAPVEWLVDSSLLGYAERD